MNIITQDWKMALKSSLFQLLKHLLATAFLTALAAVASLVASNGGAVSWQPTQYTFTITFAYALAVAFLNYYHSLPSPAQSAVIAQLQEQVRALQQQPVQKQLEAHAPLVAIYPHSGSGNQTIPLSYEVTVPQPVQPVVQSREQPVANSNESITEKMSPVPAQT